MKIEFIEFTAIVSDEAMDEYNDRVCEAIEDCIPMSECSLRELVRGDLIIQ